MAGLINPKLWGLSIFIFSLAHFKGRIMEVRFPLWRPRGMSLLYHCGSVSLIFTLLISKIYRTLPPLQHRKETPMKWYAWKTRKDTCVLASSLGAIFLFHSFFHFTNADFKVYESRGFVLLPAISSGPETAPDTWWALIKYLRKKWMKEGRNELSIYHTVTVPDTG